MSDEMGEADVKLQPFQPAAASSSCKITLKVLPLDGPPIDLDVHKLSTGAMLRDVIEGVCKVKNDVQMLARESAECEAVPLHDATTLEAQGLCTGWQICFERTPNAAAKEAGSAIPKESLARHGKLSYYHADRPKVDESDFTVASGGEPVRLETRTQIDKVIKPEFSWADDGANVKVFIERTKEPRMVKAAALLEANGGRVAADFHEDSFSITVKEADLSFTLAIAALQDRVVPEFCKVRVSPEKRITISLRKHEPGKRWFSLIP